MLGQLVVELSNDSILGTQPQESMINHKTVVHQHILISEAIFLCTVYQICAFNSWRYSIPGN